MQQILVKPILEVFTVQLTELFDPNARHLDIGPMFKIMSILGRRFNEEPEYASLQLLHCCDWKDMSIESRKEINDTLLQMIRRNLPETHAGVLANVR